MQLIENQAFDKEREFYGSDGITVRNCVFDGEADGESAFKESRNVTVEGCRWNLRYPFWHDDGIRITDTELTDKCRAALWYSKDIEIKGSKLHGTKALRECSDVLIEDTSVVSAEFGWSVDNITVRNSEFSGEYFMLRSSGLHFDGAKLDGKYSFQYITDSTFENCVFNTKDAFWHAKNVVVRNSVINGEYLAWYAENVTFENCIISGTQPLCYCKDLKLINCEMHGADLSFEKSSVDATLTAPIISIKNPKSGYINIPAVVDIIMDDPDSTCIIEISD